MRTPLEIVDRLYELNRMEREANTPEYAARQVEISRMQASASC